MSNTKIISANGFNEFGGVSYTNRNGNSSTISYGLVNTALPTEGDNQFVVDPSFAAISGSAGDTTIVNAVSGYEISVMSYTLVSDSNANIQFISSGTGAGSVTNLTGPMPFAANGGVSVNDNDIIFRTQPGENLVLKTDSGNCAGHIAYKVG